MKYELKGKITVISPIQEVGTGKKLTFRIETDEQYNHIKEFELYKGENHLEHIDNFVKYNKVGDNVSVEFDIKTFNWKPESEDKIFTSLSCWKCTTIKDIEQSTLPNVEDDELAF